MYPLDVVKTRMQLNTAAEGTGMIGLFAEVIKKEGCGRNLIACASPLSSFRFVNLYRGIPAPIMAEVLMLRLATCRRCSRYRSGTEARSQVCIERVLPVQTP